MENVVLLLGLISATLCQGAFYESKEKSLWSRQNDICIPATPPFYHETDGGYKVTESTGIGPYSKVWVGYYQVVRVFEYIGCTLANEVVDKLTRQSIAINGDPGHCFPGCGDNIIIGVTYNKCYCLGSNWTSIFPPSSDCIDRCSLIDVSCGDIFIEHFPPLFVSIYKINHNVSASTIQSTNNEGNCLSMDPYVPKRYFWDTCDTPWSPMCAVGDNVTSIFSEKSLNWIGNANLCFVKNAYPTTYSNSKHVDKQNGSKLWTGMFKTNVIYKYNAKDSAEQRHDEKKLGYVFRASDGLYYLNFSKGDYNSTVLCYEGKYDKSDDTSENRSDNSSANKSNISPDTPNDENQVTSILTGICVLLGVLVVTMSLAYLYRRRKCRDLFLQANTHVNTAVSQDNNEILSDNDYEEIHYEEIIEMNNDVASQNYYITPVEIANQDDHAQKIVNQCDQAQEITNHSEKAQEFVYQSYQAQEIANQSDQEQEIVNQSDQAREIANQNDQEQDIVNQSDLEQEIANQRDEVQEIANRKDQAQEFANLSDQAQEIAIQSNKVEEIVNQSDQAQDADNRSDQAKENFNQSYQALRQVSSRISERYQSLDAEGRELETLKNTSQTGTGEYESLQDRTIDTHNYEAPTNM